MPQKPNSGMAVSGISVGFNVAQEIYKICQMVGDFDRTLPRLIEIGLAVVEAEVPGTDSLKAEILTLIDEAKRIKNKFIILRECEKAIFQNNFYNKLNMFQMQFLVRTGSQQTVMSKNLGEILEILKCGAGSNGETSKVKVMDDKQIQATGKILEAMGTIQNQEEIDVNYYSSPPIKGCPYLERELVDMIRHSSIRFVNLSGPPSSGKTSIAKRLCTHPNLIGMFAIYYIKVGGKLPDIVVAYLCGSVNCGSEIEGEDLVALRKGIKNKGRVLIIFDNATPEWETILEKDFLSIPTCKIFVVSEVKFESADGCDLSPLYEENGKKLCFYSNKLNKDVEHGEASSSHVEEFGRPLLGWKKRLTNSHKGKSVMMYDDALGTTSSTCI